MKKLLSLLLALVLSLGCLSLLASCSKDKKDKDDSLETADVYGLADMDLQALTKLLKEKGYAAEYQGDGSGVGILESVYAYEGHELQDLGHNTLSVIRFEKKETAVFYYKMIQQEHKNKISELERKVELLDHMRNSYADSMNEYEGGELLQEYYRTREQLAMYEDGGVVLGYHGYVVWYGGIGILESISSSDTQTDNPSATIETPMYTTAPVVVTKEPRPQ